MLLNQLAIQNVLVLLLMHYRCQLGKHERKCGHKRKICYVKYLHIVIYSNYFAQKTFFIFKRLTTSKSMLNKSTKLMFKLQLDNEMVVRVRCISYHF